MNASQLIAALSALPPDTEVLVQAGDIGFTPLKHVREVLVEPTGYGDGALVGEYDLAVSSHGGTRAVLLSRTRA